MNEQIEAGFIGNKRETILAKSSEQTENKGTEVYECVLKLSIGANYRK